MEKCMGGFMNGWIYTAQCTFLCVSKIISNCFLKEKIEEID